MKKKKLSIVLAVLTTGFVITGCGTPLFELTEEEENLIAYSAARMISKYNIQQKDGMINVRIEEEEEESEYIPPVSTENDSQTQEGEQNSASGEDGEIQNKVSLESAIGHSSDLKIVYKGSSVSKHYKEGKHYSIDAESGKTFYTMKFAVTNTSKSKVMLDNVSLNPTFRLIANDIKVNADVTFLNTDLAGYLGEINAGETVDTVLLFEVSESKVKEIKTPRLQVIIGKEVKEVTVQ